MTSDLKRPAPERPGSAKRLRAADGGAVSPSGPTTPARPPRMPVFRAAQQDRRLVAHLNQLDGRELIVLVRTVEKRYRQLAAFEAAEIRRAQALGLGRVQEPMSLVAL